MKKGVVVSKDSKLTYISTQHKNINSHKHAKQYFPGKAKTKILPAKKEKFHDFIKIGDKVLYEIHEVDNTFLKVFYFGLPIIGLTVGLFLGSILLNDEIGILIYMILFMLLGINLKHIFWREFNFFKEIDVKIKNPTTKIELYKVKKTRKKNSKLVSKKSASKS